MPKVLKKEIEVYSKKEQRSLEEYLLKNKSRKNLGIFLSLYMGLRIGEVCALKWQNIDLEHSMLSIEKTLIRVRNYDEKINKKTVVILDEPKSVSSKRMIPMFLINMLKEVEGSSSSFFLTNSDNFIEPRSYLNYYKSVLKEIKKEEQEFKSYSFHALRHTFATRCIELGSDAKTLSEILGHSSVDITLNRYVHPEFESKIKLMNQLEFVKYNVSK